MQRARFITILIGLTGLLLAACGGQAPAAAPGQPNSEQPINTPVVLTLEEAESVAGTFLDAWARGDHTRMYDLVAFRSREAYPFEVFDAAYTSVADEMTLDNLEWRFDFSLRQGNTVAINYDVTFTTGFLGSFTDEGRTLRLIVTDEGWRVAWATTDIFAELAGGSALILQRTVPTRANIYDRDGEILVDQYGVAIQVWVVQENIPRWDDCFWTLTRVLRLSNAELQAIYDSRAANWETLVGEIDSETFIVDKDLLESECAATFTERDTRRYVSGGLAPHVIGYVGYPQPEQIPELRRRGVPEDAIVGITGVERSWDETLTGQPGGELIIVSPSGDVLRSLASREPGRSESVYLTIDADLQFIVQQALSDAYNVANWGPIARGASVVIMDVQTGEILALASYPSYDPNLFNPDNARFDAGRLAELLNNPRQPQINRVTQGQFAPGSVFKTVTMIASAESIYDLDRTLVCGGQWNGTQYGDILRDDWLLTGHGLLDLPGALTGSCDVYFYQAGVDLYQNDPDLLPNYAQRLGFGAPTGIQGLTEASGQVPNSQWARQQGSIWRLSDSVNMSIGQGDVLVTPLQMVRLVAAIANGGDLLVPQVVHHAQTLGEEPSYEFTPTVERNINVQPETLVAVREAMCEVTTNATLGTAEYVFGSTSSLGGAVSFSICGKTGTAQTGGSETPPHAWFSAFTPADEPRLAIVVMVENSREGSEVAAPIVRRILETYYNDVDPTFPPNWWPPNWWLGEYDPLETRGA